LISEQARLDELKIASRGYILMEPPVVAPELYSKLAEISERFERVYVHNTHGGGYSLSGVNVGRLRKLYWPLPYRGVLANYWENQKRRKKIVAINGHHKPVSHTNELYSKRIEALAVLSKTDSADLYGNGWNDWFSKRGFWLPYLLNRRAISNIYRGPCRSKYEVLSQYSFCLCFENMKMDGYVTEKIFDCLYAGTIPLYLGAGDISSYVPAEAFIDCCQFASWEDLRDFASALSQSKIDSMRAAGKAFMESDEILPFFNSFENMVFNQ
jgi:hypothetical protein